MTDAQQIRRFESWFKTAVKAQRVHEDEIDERSAESIIIDARTQGFTLSKELKKGMDMQSAPNFQPQGPAGPGGVRSSSTPSRNLNNTIKGPRSNKKKGDE